MPGRILRTWRRIVVGVLLMTLWMVLMWTTGYAEGPENVEFSSYGTMALLVLSCLILAVAVVGVAVVTLAFLAPFLLPFVEAILVALVAMVPLGLARMWAGLPAWIDCVFFGAAIFAMSQITAGLWLTGLGRRDTALKRAVFEVPRPVDKVWSRIVPLPENAGAYYWPRAAFLAPPEESDADFILLSPVQSHINTPLEAFWIEAREADRMATLKCKPLPGSLGLSERRTFRLEPVGSGTRVAIDLRFLDVPLFRRIGLWINNDPNEYFASLRAQASGRRDRSLHGRYMLAA